jgi:hypothetical protein
MSLPGDSENRSRGRPAGAAPASSPPEKRVRRGKTEAAQEFDRACASVGETLHKKFPDKTAQEWATLIRNVIVDLWGGQKIYLRKNPAADIRKDAQQMSAKQLIAKYGASRRSQIYRELKKLGR